MGSVNQGTSINRLYHISNPDVNFNGTPTGVEGSADNSRRMIEYACTTANRRTGPHDSVTGSITGPTDLDSGESGSYYFSFSGTDPGPFTYDWKFSYTGYNYLYLSNNSSAVVNVPSSNPPNKIYLRLIVTSTPTQDSFTIFYTIDIDVTGGPQQIAKGGQKKSFEFDSPEISITPNPTVDAFNLRFEAAEKGETNVILYDVQGRIIYNKEISFIPGANILKVEDLNVSPGFYIVSLFNGRLTNKLIISR